MMDPAALIGSIAAEAGKQPARPRIMEVCGTHTAAMFRHGIRSLLADAVEVVSGPGCPVCVTPDAVIDTAIGYARQGHLVATYGDMIRVPGTETSLGGARAEGADVRVVVSPLAVADLAAANPGRKVIFLAVGFETTAPGTALLLRELQARGLTNAFVLAAHKLIPPAMLALLAEGGQRIDGFLCPGHVSTVIGLEPYRRISAGFGVPCVVAGFEPEEILLSLLMLLRQLNAGRAEVENQYARAVRPEGNPRARALVDEFFLTADSVWRGFGTLPGSGLLLRERFASFDARRNLGTELPPARDDTGCACGAILRGAIHPPACPQYGRACTPATPRGPCMVSSEGACAIYYAAQDLQTVTGEAV